MPQDFSRQNLRGRNFKGQDLTGANFSHADIRGANFTNAILRGANFSDAKAGRHTFFSLVLVICSFFISLISGFVLAITSSLVAMFFLDKMIDKFFISPDCINDDWIII